MRLRNLPKLREIGFASSRRVLEVERLSHDCTWRRIRSKPSTARLRSIGNAPRDCALPIRAFSPWHGVIVFRLLPGGIRSADLRKHLASLTGRSPNALSQGAITYQLRRLHLHGIIERLPHSFCYRVTQFGFRAALFFTRLHNRLFRPGLAAIMPARAENAPRLCRAFDNLDAQINALSQHAQFAA
jgi:hypothetical protein